MVPLPEVQDSLPLVDTSSSIVDGFLENGDMPTMLNLAEEDFDKALGRLATMTKDWNVKHVAHSVKGVARNMAFKRLERYAEDVQHVGDQISDDQVPLLHKKFRTLIKQSDAEARKLI